MSTDKRIAPVMRSVLVNVDVERAFKVFTEDIGAWWPLHTHGIFGDKAKTCVLEPRVGGRVYEISVAGEEGLWASVNEFEHNKRIVLSWRPNPDRPAPTEVEVEFFDEGGRTRVELTHRNWELLGDEAREARDSYDAGWPKTLAEFARVAEEVAG